MAPPARDRRGRWSVEECLDALVDRLTSNSNFAMIFYMQVFMIRLFDFIMQVLGPILIIAGTSLIMIAAFLFLTLVLPDLATPGSLAYRLHLAVSVYLLCNVMFNYFMCAAMKPGRPAKLRSMPGLPDLEEGKAEPHLLTQDSTRSNPNLKPRRGAAPTRNTRTNHDIPGHFVVLWRYCELCKRPKPPRTHHCSVCKECVLNMDHHCPWMNNCVGYYNYRYFFLFLMWLWIGCVYVIGTTGTAFAKLYRHEGKKALRIRLALDKRTATVFCFLMAFSVCIAVCLLWGWHIYLTLTAQSTIEFHVNRERKAYARTRGRLWQNPFDLGMQRNWQQIFGSHNPLLAVQLSWRDPPPPVSPFVPENFGHDYESEARIV